MKNFLHVFHAATIPVKATYKHKLQLIIRVTLRSEKVNRHLPLIPYTVLLYLYINNTKCICQ